MYLPNETTRWQDKCDKTIFDFEWFLASLHRYLKCSLFILYISVVCVCVCVCVWEREREREVKDIESVCVIERETAFECFVVFCQLFLIHLLREILLRLSNLQNAKRKISSNFNQKWWKKKLFQKLKESLQL